VNWVNLNEVTGFEVENSNPVLFAEAIDKLLENDELRNRYAINAEQRVLDNFVMDKIKPQLEKIYSELLS
jgi:glycosyltransferase involved in cell wall biosynthesis